MNPLLKLDHDTSKSFFRFASSHGILRRLAIFGASELIWLLFGFALGYFWLGAQSVDPGRFPAEWWLLMVVIAVPWAVTLALEYAFRRARPFDAGKYAPLIQMMIKTPAFPSGHSAIAFAIAYFMTVNSELGLGFLIAAALVALSRVAVGVHYVSDIIVGSVIGWVGGYVALAGLMVALLATK